MMSPADRPEVAPPIRWANVFLWQCVGCAVGGMLPAAGLAAVAALLPREWFWLLWAAPVALLGGVAVGGTFGTVIGVLDKAPTFGWRRRLRGGEGKRGSGEEHGPAEPHAAADRGLHSE